jgi:hypothetical protein
MGLTQALTFECPLYPLTATSGNWIVKSRLIGKFSLNSIWRQLENSHICASGACTWAKNCQFVSCFNTQPVKSNKVDGDKHAIFRV